MTVKVFIDQFIQAPILLAFIIMGMALMEGRGFQGIKTDIQTEYWSTLIQNWKLWSVPGCCCFFFLVIFSLFFLFQYFNTFFSSLLFAFF